MMVIFVSQCEKNALKKTRRILDSFANRIGDNTWRTIITREGLGAVFKLLRKTASKSTAVSCHWIRSRSRSDFLWVVGNMDRFNEEGVVPVHWTAKTILDNYKESEWKYIPLIKALTALSALFHDWGKSTKLFQEKLKPNSKIKADPIRHEWISCILLNIFISQNKEDWLHRLSDGIIDETLLMDSAKDVDERVLQNLPSFAQLIMWLIVSHHKLPSVATAKKNIVDDGWNGVASFSIEDTLQYIKKSWGYENKRDEKEYQKRLEQCFIFPHGLLSNSSKWLTLVKRWATKLLAQQSLLDEAIKDGSYRAVLHHCRLCLMLGDHNYSSQDKTSLREDTKGLFANTHPKTKELNQKLDDHLCGVYKSAMQIVHYLPMFESQSPFVENNKVLKRASPKEFIWQDKAVKKIREVMSQESKKRGFFAVNMASTGCGKTFANAKVMQAISKDGDSLRYVLALGLRTLTLQTGDEYRERIELSKEDLAVLIGSKAIMELHENQKKEDEQKSDFGSESLESLLDEEVIYEFDIPDDALKTVLKKERDRNFLYAPVLVCTIDHLMGAVTTKKGGRYILPSLRMLSSDLVIDEIDDFSGSDLIAIGRLVHLAGMLGRGVMISSATIPPDLAKGYFNAYKKGWQLYVKSHESKNKIVCAWIDEFKTDVKEIDSFESKKALEMYEESHNNFIDKRIQNLEKEPVKRKVEIVECHEEMQESEDETKTDVYFSKIKDAIIQKHQEHHTIDKKSAKRISFGVVRVANTPPCVALSRYLAMVDNDDVELKVMAYHSSQVLLLRHEQEKHLDAVLKRKESKGKEPEAFKDKIIRSHIDASKTQDVIFVLVATPVEEVGRDHDFDWAIIEPSSYRSIIQLAGRVRRHRVGEIVAPNIGLMQYNYKAFKGSDEEGKRYFNRPGYEENITLNTHSISKLIDTDKIANRLDAQARIKKPQKLDAKNSLIDLEHCMTQKDLTSFDKKGADTFEGYLNESWFLTAHPLYLHPFRESLKNTNIFLVYNEKEDNYFFSELDEYGKLMTYESGYPVNREEMLKISRADEDNIDISRLWLHRDYDELVEEYASKNNQTKEEVSLRYGELNFVIYKQGDEFEYSDQFGLVRV
ncbi:MAG: type I-F CRISPR-associated helicase Cas3f [Sulfurimonas sp.]|nr:type I-F CRISPR-associated helicase Cas3f [Sulfurimonas sp.]MDD3835456.1 type I-F CRISPR-associated helicase Cas3f [Sulfurimonas sp.]